MYSMVEKMNFAQRRRQTHYQIPEPSLQFQQQMSESDNQSFLVRPDSRALLRCQRTSPRGRMSAPAPCQDQCTDSDVLHTSARSLDSIRQESKSADAAFGTVTPMDSHGDSESVFLRNATDRVSSRL